MTNVTCWSVRILSSDNVPPQAGLDELYVQWDESSTIGEALADLIQDGSAPNGQPMQAALRELAGQVLDYRRALRAQIAARGGAAPR